MTVTESTLDLREVSKMTVRARTDAYKIAKIVPDFNIEQDRDDLVAIPLPDTPSMVEIWMNEAREFRRELDEFKRENQNTKDELRSTKNELCGVKDELSGTKSELSTVKDELKTERSKNSYYFGALTIIRIWSNMSYEKVATPTTTTTTTTTSSSSSKNEKKPFKDFFNGFIYPSLTKKKDPNNDKLQHYLDLSTKDLDFIADLNDERNVHAHGEKEFFYRVESNDPVKVNKAFEQLKKAMEEAQYYQGKNPRIVAIASKFLHNIHQDLLKRNLMTN